MRVLLAIALVLISGRAYAARWDTPDWFRIQQGATSDGAIVDCGISSTSLFNCPTATALSSDWRVVTCTNDGSNKVYICPHLCSGCTTTSGSFIALPSGASFTFGGSARSLQLSCIASGGTSKVRCFAER
jgi:streptolysin S family bacteriocin protoxin